LIIERTLQGFLLIRFRKIGKVSSGFRASYLAQFTLVWMNLRMLSLCRPEQWQSIRRDASFELMFPFDACIVFFFFFLFCVNFRFYWQLFCVFLLFKYRRSLLPLLSSQLSRLILMDHILVCVFLDWFILCGLFLGQWVFPCKRWTTFSRNKADFMLLLASSSCICWEDFFGRRSLYEILLIWISSN
jgi:hypothetical protein